MVTEPTRQENILDLFLTTNHTLIDKVSRLSLGDHDIVTALGSLKPTMHKQKPRQVHLFSKANWEKLKSLMKNYQEAFLLDCNGKTVEELWLSFTFTLEKFVNEYVPTKLIRGKASLPLITQEIKRLIRKRDKLYVSYKKSGDLDKKKSFQSLRKLIKRKIKDSYHVYLENLLGLGDGEVYDSKKLFSFLKNFKQDQQGTLPLKGGDKIIPGTVGKAHNKQFHSVFTPKSPLSLARLSQMKVQDSVDSGLMDPATIPPEYLTTTPVLSDIDISLNGILKLLNNLKPGKAAGPDKLRPLLLKELLAEIAPIIKAIFRKPLRQDRSRLNGAELMWLQFSKKKKTNHLLWITARFPLLAFSARSLSTSLSVGLNILIRHSFMDLWFWITALVPWPQLLLIL